MLKIKLQHTRFSLIIAFLVIGFGLTEALAADCGGATACNCGDTVIASTTLSTNLDCSGAQTHGLTVGADNITINGGGHTLKGRQNLGKDKNNGINIVGYNNITVTNFSNITDFDNGILVENSNSNIISYNSTNLNVYGIYLYSASSTLVTENVANNNNGGILIKSSINNTISQNTTNQNREGAGIELGNGADNNTIIGNISNENVYGIDLSPGSISNTVTDNSIEANKQYGIFIKSNQGINNLSGNQMLDNFNNLFVEGVGYEGYHHNIDNTNLVQGKPVYYLYGESDQIYDGDIIGDIGMFWCISCSEITLKNSTMASNNANSIFLLNTSYSIIENVISNNSSFLYDTGGDGLYLRDSDNNQIKNITANYNNRGGIDIENSDNNTLINNKTYNNGRYGIMIGLSSLNNTLTNNQIFGGMSGLNDAGNSNKNGNSSLHNVNNTMLSYNTGEKTADINEEINLELDLFDADGNDCPDCSYLLSVYPNEEITIEKTGNHLTASFTPTRRGVYSVAIFISDENNNTTKRNLTYLIGETENHQTKYYFRGAMPTKGQPIGLDARTFLKSAPTEDEEWSCTFWIINSIDEIPDYPLSNLSSINSYSSYRLEEAGVIGAQKLTDYTGNTNISSSTPISIEYSWINNNFNNLNWDLDYARDWYRMSLKLNGFAPKWQTTPGQPAYANFNYQYTNAPAIKTITNDNINVLAATASLEDNNDAKIILENSLDIATSTSLVLSETNKPFLGATSTIDSNATTTLEVNIPGQSSLNLESIDMSLTPSADSVQVNIEDWNNTGNYYKNWREESASHDISVLHEIGGLLPNKPYKVKVDGSTLITTESDTNGNLSFSYNGGYSSKNFELFLATPPIILINGQNPASIYQGQIYNDAGATASDDVDGDISANIIINNQVNTNITGSYTVIYSVSDSAGNQGSATRTVNVLSRGGGSGGGSSNNSCTQITYSEWTKCNNGLKSRTVVSHLPASCNLNVEQQLSLSQSCENTPETPETPLINNETDNIKDVLALANKNFTKINKKLINNLRGNIVLQVEEHGEAWYLNPRDEKKYYLSRPNEAFLMMRALSVGVSNADLWKIPVGLIKDLLVLDTDSDKDGLSDRMEKGLFTNLNQADSDKDGFTDYLEIDTGNNPLGSGKIKIDQKIIDKLKGKILLQTENNGEAWYLNPLDQKRYYLGRPAEAFAIMQHLSIGISNKDLNQIPIGPELK